MSVKKKIKNGTFLKWFNQHFKQSEAFTNIYNDWQ